MKIVVGGFYHESNTFNPFATTTKDFVFAEGDQMLSRVAATEIFKEKGIEVIPTIYAFGLSSGVLKEETYQYYVEKILKVIQEEKDIDGVWFHLHGAMYVENIGSGELYLLKEVKRILGKEIPISITLDIHANNALDLGEYANIIRSYRSVPHIDQQETEEITANLLVKCLEEKAKIKPALKRVPMTIGGEMALGDVEPMKSIFEKLEELEQIKGIATASFFLSFAWGDTENTAASVVVVPDSEEYSVLAENKAEELAQYVFDKRKEFNFDAIALEPQEAINMALSSQLKPIFISDSGDNTTGGAVGINTVLLDLLVNQQDLNGKKICFAAIFDGNSYGQCQQYDVGDAINISVGIDYDEDSKGIEIKGRLKAKGELMGYLGCTSDKVGDVCVIALGSIDVVIANRGDSFITLDHFKAAGLDIEEYDIIIIKQGYLFDELSRIAKLSILALTPGATYQKIERLKYSNIPRPIFPLDE